MLKIGKKTSEPQDEAKSCPSEGKTSWFKNNQRSIMAVTLIALMAFVMRFIFAYGTSADSAFALSGGTSASEHLRTVTSIVSGTYTFGLSDTASYPFETANTNPILIDLLVAPFAMIGKACGMTAADASAAALSWFSVIFGTLCVVVMYFLGKEVVGTKKAGYLAAFFLAFCPIVISQTVFSNGTEVAVYGFMVILFFLFVYKGLKKIDSSVVSGKFSDVFKANKGAMKDALIAGIILTLIAYSWNGFRPLVAILIIAMVIMMVILRLKGKDVRASVMFYSSIIAIGIIIALPYYIVAGLWDLVFSGTFYLAVIWIVVAVAFALLQKKPWIVTVPVFTIALIVAFGVLAIVAPNTFSLIFSGNSYLASAFDGLNGSTNSISEMAVYFGYLTMWLGLAVFAVMLYKLPKNISSPVYVFTMIFILMGTYYSTKSTLLSVVFAPVFALGFAYTIVWLFNSVDFKAYFVSLKNADLKSVWKKVLKPIPFLSIIGVVLLICIPNAMYAIDASIPSNNADSIEGYEVNAVNYYIKTDSDWPTNTVYKTYSDVEKSGALVTWVDYTDDAIAYGNFKTIADSTGNGADAVTNILLGDGTNGASTAAMLVYLLKYTGFNDSVKVALTGAGLSETHYDTLKDVIQNPANYKSTVLKNESIYGAVSTSISDSNVAYIYSKVFLTDNYTSYDISAMFEAIEKLSGKTITYFMVNGNMFPLQYGSSSTFATMGYVNDYAITDSYGTVGQFETVDYFTQYYTGMYNYTDAMYNTLLWRMYIGMSPADAGYTGMLGAYNLISALSISDGTVKAQPGYGLSNYVVDYDSWYVMYNADSDVTSVSADGWTKMLYNEAIQLQESKGGVINYLSGLPIFFKYVPTTDGQVVSGKITDASSQAVSGIRVSVINSDGAVCSTDVSDEDGTYKVFVTDGGSKINYYAGSSSLNDGVLIKTIKYTGGTTSADVTVNSSTFKGTLVNSDNELVNEMEAVVKLTGSVSKMTYTCDVDSATMSFSFTNVIPDVYTITVTSPNGKVSYLDDDDDLTYTVQVGENVGYKLELQAYTLTMTVNDNDTSSTVPSGTSVTIVSAESGAEYTETVGSDGKAVFNDIIAGTYFTKVDGYATTSSSFSLSSTTSQTVTVVQGTSVYVHGLPVGKVATIYGTGYTATTVIDADPCNITVPTGTAFGAEYSVYAYDGAKVYTAKITAGTMSSSASSSDAVKVTGTVKNASETETSATIVFIDSDGVQISVPVDTGKYTAYLAAGTYAVYAYDSSSDVYISDAQEISQEKSTFDVNMVDGQTISITSYWYTSSYYLGYQVIEISDIKGSEKTYTTKFSLLTDSTGKATFYIPNDMTCSVTAILPDSGCVYYKDGESKEYTSVKTDVTTSATFTATFDKVTIQNDTDYKITVGKDSTEIESGASAEISISTRIVSIKVDYVDGPNPGSKYYYSGSIYMKPMSGVYTVTSDTVDPVGYNVLTVNCENDTDNVTITAAADGDYESKSTSDKTKTYYVEIDDSYTVEVRDTDSTKIWYGQCGPVVSDVEMTVALKPYASISGYVGITESGTLSITSDANGWTIHTDISSGKYEEVDLPLDSKYTLYAEVYVGDEGKETASYVATREISSDDMAAGKSYTYNLAVGTDPGFAPYSADTVEASSNIVDVTAIESGAARNTVTVKVTASMIDVLSEVTYLLSGGEGWLDVQFYSDAACTQQITAVTLSGVDSEVYAKGTVDFNKAAVGNESFSIIFTDGNENVGCTSVITDTDGKYAKTVNKTSAVNYGTDVAGNGEYQYAIEIVNKDNYTKQYLVKVVDGLDTSKWFITYVQDDKYCTDPSMTVDVPGYTTSTVYVKITSKITDGTEAAPTSYVKTTVEVITAGESLTTEDADGITIDGAKATVLSSTSKTMLEVSKSGASGRGVFNDLGSMPTYIWVLVAISVLLFLVTIWLASKRGVFSRKK